MSLGRTRIEQIVTHNVTHTKLWLSNPQLQNLSLAHRLLHLVCRQGIEKVDLLDMRLQVNQTESGSVSLSTIAASSVFYHAVAKRLILSDEEEETFFKYNKKDGIEDYFQQLGFARRHAGIRHFPSKKNYATPKRVEGYVRAGREISEKIYDDTVSLKTAKDKGNAIVRIKTNLPFSKLYHGIIDYLLFSNEETYSLFSPMGQKNALDTFLQKDGISHPHR